MWTIVGTIVGAIRLNNKLDFSQEEILKASELLGIQTKLIPKYFFKEKV